MKTMRRTLAAMTTGAILAAFDAHAEALTAQSAALFVSEEARGDPDSHAPLRRMRGRGRRAARHGAIVGPPQRGVQAGDWGVGNASRARAG